MCHLTGVGGKETSHRFTGVACQRVIFFSLTRRFLCEFYQTLDEAVRTFDGEAPSALHRIAVRPDVESLFHSLSPYFLCGQALPEETARLKMTESAYLLLNSDRSYAAALFDFTSTCKMNMLDLLVEHDSTDFRWKLYFIRKNSRDKV